MFFGTDCSGDCYDCINFYIPGSCLAGHGDDHFKQITIDNIKGTLVRLEDLENKYQKDYKKQFLDKLQKYAPEMYKKLETELTFNKEEE